MRIVQINPFVITKPLSIVHDKIYPIIYINLFHNRINTFFNVARPIWQFKKQNKTTFLFLCRCFFHLTFYPALHISISILHFLSGGEEMISVLRRRTLEMQRFLNKHLLLNVSTDCCHF